MPKGYCRCLRPSVCLSVSKIYIVRTMTSQIWAGITKFAPNMHPEILSVGPENGHWPWPSMSFRPFGLGTLGILICPRDNLLFTKFATYMYLEILSADIEVGSHAHWLSGSFGHCDLELKKKKRPSTSLLYTDLGRPKGVARFFL